MLSICYITSRINPLLEMFVDSLDYQTTPFEKESEIEIIFVDRLLDPIGKDAYDMDRLMYIGRTKHFSDVVADRFKYRHIAPKPSPWQGSSRLTKEDWFAASNARNSGLIASSGEHIVFVDDLSVLTGTWWKAVKESAQSGKVTCGAYRKVKELRVDNGNIVHFSNDTSSGVDNRFQYGNDNGPVPCQGQWLYGCSFSAPAQLLLDVNGSDEACDGMGFEDCILGIRLANSGAHFQYDRRMMSYESEEAHHFDKVMKRIDKGISPNDKSHAILKLAQGTNRAENSHFGSDGIAGLRKQFQKTEQFPSLQLPTTDWYDGQPIVDFA